MSEKTGWRHLPLDEENKHSSIYPYRIQVHNVENLEGLCRHIFLDQAGQQKPEAYRDAVCFLVSESFALYDKFDPERNDNFRGYLAWLLRKRLVDYWSESRVKRRHDVVAGDRSASEIAPPESLDEGRDRFDNSLQVAAKTMSLGDDLDLSPRNTWVLHNVAMPLSEGEAKRSVAARLDTTTKAIDTMMERLRLEMQRKRGD